MSTDLEDRLRGALRYRLDAVPAPHGDEGDVRKRAVSQRRRRSGVVAGSALVFAAAGVATLVTAGDAPTSSVGVAQEPTATPDVSGFAALGLGVRMPMSWSTDDDATCPAPFTLHVRRSPGAVPFWSAATAAGCPESDGPWMAVEPIPEDLDGYDTNCGPAHQGMPQAPFGVCQLMTKDGTTILLIDRVGVIVTTPYLAEADDLPKVAVLDESLAASRAEVERDSRQAFAADAADRLERGECVEVDPTVLPVSRRWETGCAVARPPEGSQRVAVVRAAPGGAVSPVAYDVVFDGSGGRSVLRLAVGMRWSRAAHRMVPVLGEVVEAPPDGRAACWWPRDERFMGLPCEADMN
jgi:hypothetical protein